MFLVSLAMADQRIDPREQAALERIAVTIGFGAARLEQLLRMARAQEHFHGSEGYVAQPGTSLDDAYAALGVDKAVSDRGAETGLPQAYERKSPGQADCQGCAREYGQAGDGALPGNSGGLRYDPRNAAEQRDVVRGFSRQALYIRQKAGVNSTSRVNTSSRPSNIAKHRMALAVSLIRA